MKDDLRAQGFSETAISAFIHGRSKGPTKKDYDEALTYLDQTGAVIPHLPRTERQQKLFDVMKQYAAAKKVDDKIDWEAVTNETWDRWDRVQRFPDQMLANLKEDYKVRPGMPPIKAATIIASAGQPLPPDMAAAAGVPPVRPPVPPGSIPPTGPIGPSPARRPHPLPDAGNMFDRLVTLTADLGGNLDQALVELKLPKALKTPALESKIAAINAHRKFS